MTTDFLDMFEYRSLDGQAYEIQVQGQFEDRPIIKDVFIFQNERRFSEAELDKNLVKRIQETVEERVKKMFH